MTPCVFYRSLVRILIPAMPLAVDQYQMLRFTGSARIHLVLLFRHLSQQFQLLYK